MTQSQQIKTYLSKGNTLTGMEALHMFKCFRLPARVFELNEQGMNIKSEMIYFNKKRFARYFIDKEPWLSDDESFSRYNLSGVK